jgi:hypothetical protein
MPHVNLRSNALTDNVAVELTIHLAVAGEGMYDDYKKSD